LVTIGAQSTTATELQLLVESTCIKKLCEGKWAPKKHGAGYCRRWCKAYPGIDVGTLEIRALEVTERALGDAPIPPCLLDQIVADEKLASVSGDGTYNTKGCRESTAQLRAQAIIPTHKSTKSWKVLAPVPKSVTSSCQSRADLAKIWKKWIS